MRVSRAAINTHLSVLRKSGLVTSVGSDRSDKGTLGRPAELVAIDKRANGLAVAVLGNHQLQVGLVSMGMEVLWQENRRVDETIDNASLTTLLKQDLDRIGQEATARGVALRHALICVAGKIDPLTGAVEASVHFPNLHYAPVEEQLGRHLAVPLRVLVDAHAVSAGVLATCGPSVGQVDVIQWGAGITWMCASSMNPFGMVFPHWRPIGHVRVAPGGRRCYCGGRGCIEAEVGGRGILKQMAESDPARAGLDMESLRALLEAGDAQATAIVEASAERLGRYVSYIIQMSNPERLVIESHFGGQTQFLREAFLRGLTPELHLAQAERLRVEVCQPESIPRIAGAASLAEELFFDPELIHRVRAPSGYVVDEYVPDEMPFSEMLRSSATV